MLPKELQAVNRLVWTALMAALTAAGAFVTVPMWPVPVSLQTLFVYLSGFVLGPVWGPASILLYLFAGLVGLPIFTGGKSGPAVFLGPTGGYLFGFILGALVAGLALVPGKRLSWPRGLIFGLLALVVLFTPGVIQLKHVVDASWSKALAIGVLPFLPGDIAKVALAVVAVRYLKRQRFAPGDPGV